MRYLQLDDAANCRLRDRFKLPRSALCSWVATSVAGFASHAFEEVASCRCDRHHAISGDGPPSGPVPTALENRDMPCPSCQSTLIKPPRRPLKDEQLPAVRITPQRLLNHERQAIKSLTHVGVAGRKPNSRIAWHRDHRRRLPFANAFISAVTVGASTAPVIRIRPPVANSISITPALSATGGADAASGSGAIATGLNAAGTWVRSHSCWRQRNNWLVWIPAARATSERPRLAHGRDKSTASSPLATNFVSLHRRDHFNLRLGHRSSPRITPRTCPNDLAPQGGPHRALTFRTR